jgi:hypothetical protein
MELAGEGTFECDEVDLPKGKHTLTDDTSGLVRVSVIVDDLGGNRECRDGQVVSGGTTSSNESRLETLQQVECGKGHRECEPRAMECTGNESCKGRGESG